MKKYFPFLLAGLITLYFSNGRFGTALAAWLFPFFFLQVSRERSFKYAAFIFPFITAITLQAAFWKFTSSNTANILFYVPFFAGLLFGFTFYLDRKYFLKNPQFSSTLLLPALYTTLDFVNSLVNPFGTTGVLGYSQIEFLPLAQLASITGMWGLTFFIIWFGSVLDWAVRNGFKNSQKGILAFALCMLLIIGYGSFRLLMPIKGHKVIVAGMHTTDKERDGKAFWKALAQKDTAAFNNASNNQINALIKTTIVAANKGAKFILWSEVSPTILNSHQDTLHKRLSNLAKHLKIYLVTNPYVASINNEKPENKIWLFSPTGELVFTHYKYGGNFLEGSVEGNKKLTTITTPYGKVAGIVCWDADFPSIVKQVGKLNADVVFNPASDWREIDPLHTKVALFRAIENGCSWVRQTRNGLSIIVDARGKTIAHMDHFDTDNWVNKGEVSFTKIWTLYPIIGDVFGWLAIVIVIFFFTKGVLSKKN